MEKPIDTRYQSKHTSLLEAKTTALEQSRKKHGVAFGIIEDLRDKVIYVEEDYSFLRGFEKFHGEYLDGRFIKPENDG
jgi:hypothetical protein